MREHDAEFPPALQVWDLRTLKLQRCAPCLDSAVLTWNAGGDCGYATLRRTSDDLGAALMPKRAKHPLHAAFRTVSATFLGDPDVNGLSRPLKSHGSLPCRYQTPLVAYLYFPPVSAGGCPNLPQIL